MRALIYLGGALCLCFGVAACGDCGGQVSADASLHDSTTTDLNVQDTVSTDASQTDRWQSDSNAADSALVDSLSDLTTPADLTPADLTSATDSTPADLTPAKDSTAATDLTPVTDTLVADNATTSPDAVATVDAISSEDSTTVDALEPCLDNQLSPGETDVDCGGLECAACAAGAQCILDRDCIDGPCQDGHCVAWGCVGLAAEWLLDDGSNSLVGDARQNFFGQIAGEPLWLDEGSGTFMHFGGQGHVAFADAPGLDPKTHDFSVSTWFRIPTGERGQRRMVAHGTHGAGGWDGFALMQWCESWGRDVPCGAVGLLLGSDFVGEWLVTTCQALDDNLWHQLTAVVRRNANIELYLDGERVAQPCGDVAADAQWAADERFNISHLESDDIDSPCALCIGASCQRRGVCGIEAEAFVGDLDHVAIWQRALAASEVAQHFAQGKDVAVCALPCGLCGASSCTDQTVNGVETDVDCGGALCPVCQPQLSCAVDADCATDRCNLQSCANSGCQNLSAGWLLNEGAGTEVADVNTTHLGTIEGNPVWQSGSLRFDGNDLVRVADAAELDPETSDMSIEAWVLLPVGSQAQRRIVAHGTWGGQRAGVALMEWCAWGNSACGSLGLLLGVDSGGEYLVASCAPYTDGNWHHVVANLRRAGSIELYIDGYRVVDICGGTSGGAAWNNGTFADIAHLSTTSIDTPCDLCIGSSCQNSSGCTGTTESFVGDVDEVAIYKRCLSPTEIFDHFVHGAERWVCLP